MESIVFGLQTNKQTFKVRQPQRAARSKRPNTPSDGSKNNGFHTTNQEKYPSRHPTNKSPRGSTCGQIKHNPEHQGSKMSRKAKTQACIHLDCKQFLIRRTTRKICRQLRIKHIQMYPSRHPTNHQEDHQQARCPVMSPQLYHPRGPANQG